MKEYLWLMVFGVLGACSSAPVSESESSGVDASVDAVQTTDTSLTDSTHSATDAISLSDTSVDAPLSDASQAKDSSTMADTASSDANVGSDAVSTNILFSTSFEANAGGASCINESAFFTNKTTAFCDSTTRATHGVHSASLGGGDMLVLYNAFSVSSGHVWLSYDLFAAAQPSFTLMMEGWRRGMNASAADNPWENRNPFSLEWRDGWFAMNCNYPNDHGSVRRSPQVSLPFGVNQWANVVVHYNLDTEQGEFWVRPMSNGQPSTTLNLQAPTGTVDCSGLGNRGDFDGLAMTNFQYQNPIVPVSTDRWILSRSHLDMP